MRVLVLHNRYQQAGGEDVVVQAEKSLLSSFGHEVELLEVHNDEISGPMGKTRAALGMLYSLDGKKRALEAIQRFRPAVVHVHNFFPLFSPSIYDACRASGLPVVQTLHNYRLACPNALLFREGRVCEDCLSQPLPWPGAFRGCYRGSRVQSTGVATMIVTHRLLRTWWKRVDAFIALTEFQKRKLMQAGLPGERMHVKPNFAFDPGMPEWRRESGAYALYVGRLSEEKGIEPLIRAYTQHGLQIPLKVLGTGPLLEPMRQSIEEAGLSEVVSFLGRREQAEVTALMQGARLLAFPSVCYEGFPMAIAEAFATGLPVLASELGAVPEILLNGEAGWLAPPGDSDAWAMAMQAAWNDLDDCRARGRIARRAYQEYYTPEANHEQLMQIYQAAIRRSDVYASHP